jgi:hypothetical protein
MKHDETNEKEYINGRFWEKRLFVKLP